MNHSSGVKDSKYRALNSSSQKKRSTPQFQNPKTNKSASNSLAGQNNSSPCPHAKTCGGCQLQSMNYSRQLAYKQAYVEKLLRGFHSVSPIIGMEKPVHYRNKVQAAFGWDRSRKKVISGIYQTGSHRIVPVDSCMIEDQKADEIIVTIRKMLPQFKLTPFDERIQEGFLRHVLVKRGFTSGQIMVVLVIGTSFFPAKKHFVAALRQKHPEITTIITSLNRSHTSMVLGDREEVLYGPGYIEDTLCGCVFRISARSFYQINPVQTEKLYQKAIELAQLTGKERVIDAYCGIGTIGMIAAKHANQVLGIELNREAVRDAIANAKRNQMDNIHFTCADAGKYMLEMAARKEQADVVFMDPPRAGSDEAFLSSVCVLEPRRIVYISCNPQTQQRDLTYLVQHGYQINVIQPVDMFPYTEHVETVVLLSHKTPDSYIHIDVDFGEDAGKTPTDKIIERANLHKPKIKSPIK